MLSGSKQFPDYVAPVLVVRRPTGGMGDLGYSFCLSYKGKSND